MSDLLGVWSLVETPVGPDAPDNAKPIEEAGLAAMLAQLSTHRDQLEQMRSPRCWLWARRGKIRRSGPDLFAAEGFLLEPGLRAFEQDADSIPDGHLVWVRCSPTEVFLSRSLSGGERLYFAQVGQWVWFASSVRPLLAHPKIPSVLNKTAIDEVLLSGRTLFRDHTLHEGIREVLAGCSVSLTQGVGPQQFLQADVLHSPIGDPRTLGAGFREALIEAVVAAAGSSRPVRVALSGGIDSSAIAAAAMEAFHADDIEAITYEFSDPTHATEVQWARRVVKHLGMTRHHVFAFDPQAYVDAIPEMIWRSESLSHWPKAFMLLVARTVARRGGDRYLTGFGIGSHMGFLHDLGVLHRILPSHRWLSHWKASRFTPSVLPDRLARLHPSLEIPHPRLYALLVGLLTQVGVIEDSTQYFSEHLERLMSQVPTGSSVPELEALPLERRLQLTAFAHLVSCIDVTRSEKASRELGVFRISPAHFRSCIGAAYFPVLPPPRLWSADRSLRPGKLLLRHAFQDRLPDEVLYRVKSWGDAVASNDWLQQGRRKMLSCLPHFPADAERYGPGYAAAIRWWEPHSLLATSLAMRVWERIFIERPVQNQPPTWQELRKG